MNRVSVILMKWNVCNSTQKWNYHEYQCECKEFDDWSSCRDDYMWNPNPCYCKCDKKSKIDECLDTKNCSCKKHLFDESVFACEDEILNTTKSSTVDEKVTYEEVIALFTPFH